MSFYVYTPQFFEGSLARGTAVDNEFTRLEAALGLVEAEFTEVRAELDAATGDFLTEDEIEALVASTVQAGGPALLVPIADFNNTGLGDYQVPSKFPGAASGAVVDKLDLSGVIAQHRISAYLASRPTF